MSTDDILGRMRDEFPAEMAQADRIMFRAGYTKMGQVVAGYEGQVRDFITSIIPQSHAYFFGTHTHATGSIPAGGDHLRGM